MEVIIARFDVPFDVMTFALTQTKFPVKIENSSDNQGKVIIYYKNLKELDQICEFIYSK